MSEQEWLEAVRKWDEENTEGIRNKSLKTFLYLVQRVTREHMKEKWGKNWREKNVLRERPEKNISLDEYIDNLTGKEVKEFLEFYDFHVSLRKAYDYLKTLKEVSKYLV